MEACARFHWRTVVVASAGCTVLLATPLYVAYAAISNGAAAIDALGQYDDSLTDPQPVYTKSAANNGPNKLGLDQPYGNPVIDAERHRLFVPDANNNRVLAYALNADHTLPDHLPDYVLGQQNFYTRASGTTASTMNFPMGLAIDAANDYLFVVDHANHRVLVFDISSLSSGMSASMVIGQSILADNTPRTTQAGLRAPWTVEYVSTGSMLFVADRDNNRVLVFSGSISTGMNAWLVIGQPSFTASGSATTQSGLNSPRGLAYDSSGNRLFIGEWNNHRILVFSGSELSNGMNAVHVLGQTTFTAGSSATTQSRLFNPADLEYGSGSHLFVADTTNRRVLVFNVESIGNGENAVHVLGQTTFTTRTFATSQAGMGNIRAVTYDPSARRLYVSETDNNRIDVFDVAGITNGEAAVDLLGQLDDSTSDPQPVYTKITTNNAPSLYGFNLSSQTFPSVAIDETNHRLFVLDTANRRVLVYNLSASNTLSDRIPDHVIGQANFYSNTSANTQSGLSTCNGLAYDSSNNRLFVSCDSVNKILVYDVSTVSNGMNASYILGQTTFTATTGGTNLAKFSSPHGIAYDEVSDRLFVGDSSNNRVVVYVFTGGTITSGMTGSYVLGQSSTTTSTAATSQGGMRTPRGVSVDSNNGRLFVADSNNNRVLVYELSNGVSNGINASYVLGQTSFTVSGSSVTASTMNQPRGLAYAANQERLYIGDVNNNRVLMFDVSSISDGEHAANVLGQSDFTTSTAAVTQTGLSAPRGLAYDNTNQRLLVVDSTNNRTMFFDVSVESSSSSSSLNSTESTTTGGGGGGGHRGSSEQMAKRIEQAKQTLAGRYQNLLATAPIPAAPEDTGSLDEKPRDEPTPVPAPSPSSPFQIAEKRGRLLVTFAGEAILYKDIVPTAWYAPYVTDLIKDDIARGYKDAEGNLTGEFGVEKSVTRAELLKMALEATGKAPDPNARVAPQNRSARDTWAALYVKQAEDLGFTVFKASPDVNTPATRGEVVQTVLEALGFPIPNTAASFSDVPPSHPYSQAIGLAAYSGFVQGDTATDGTPLNRFRPDDPINRAEVAKIIALARAIEN